MLICQLKKNKKITFIVKAGVRARAGGLKAPLTCHRGCPSALFLEGEGVGGQSFFISMYKPFIV